MTAELVIKVAIADDHKIFRDGINADRDATDYKKEKFKVDDSQKVKIHLAPGGGFAMRIVKLQRIMQLKITLE